MASNAPAPQGHRPSGPGHERSGQVSKMPAPNAASVQPSAHSSGHFRSQCGGRATSHWCSGPSPADTVAATAAEAAR